MRYPKITLISILINIDLNIINNTSLNMVKLRKALDGSYFVVIRRALVDLKQWKEGDEIALLSIGQDVIPQQGDYIIRKIGNGR